MRVNREINAFPKPSDGDEIQTSAQHSTDNQ